MKFDKKRLVSLFIYKYGSIVYCGALSTAFTYHTTKIYAKHSTLDCTTIKNICSALQNFELDKSTQIVVDNQIQHDEPIYQYLRIVHQHIDFKLHSTSIEQVFNRIATFHRSFKKKDRRLVQTDYNYLYKMMRAREVCNWISRDVDVDIAQMSNSDAKVQKILRIGLYYMCIKNYFNQKNKKSK